MIFVVGRLSGEVGELYRDRVDDQAVVVGIATRYKLSRTGHDVESVAIAVDGECAAHIDAIEGDGFGVCDAVGIGLSAVDHLKGLSDADLVECGSTPGE